MSAEEKIRRILRETSLSQSNLKGIASSKGPTQKSAIVARTHSLEAPVFAKPVR